MTLTLTNPLSFYPKPITFRFDNYAWITACEALGIELHQMGEVDERKLLISLIFGAYVSNCRYNARRERYDLAAIYKMFSKFSIGDVDKLKMAMLKGRIMGKTVLEWSAESEAQKKK